MPLNKDVTSTTQTNNHRTHPIVKSVKTYFQKHFPGQALKLLLDGNGISDILNNQNPCDIDLFLLHDNIDEAKLSALSFVQSIHFNNLWVKREFNVDGKNYKIDLRVLNKNSRLSPTFFKHNSILLEINSGKLLHLQTPDAAYFAKNRILTLNSPPYLISNIIVSSTPDRALWALHLITHHDFSLPNPANDQGITLSAIQSIALRINEIPPGKLAAKLKQYSAVPNKDLIAFWKMLFEWRIMDFLCLGSHNALHTNQTSKPIIDWKDYYADIIKNHAHKTPLEIIQLIYQTFFPESKSLPFYYTTHKNAIFKNLHLIKNNLDLSSPPIPKPLMVNPLLKINEGNTFSKADADYWLSICLTLDWGSKRRETLLSILPQPPKTNKKKKKKKGLLSKLRVHLKTISPGAVTAAELRKTLLIKPVTSNLQTTLLHQLGAAERLVIQSIEQKNEPERTASLVTAEKLLIGQTNKLHLHLSQYYTTAARLHMHKGNIDAAFQCFFRGSQLGDIVCQTFFKAFLLAVHHSKKNVTLEDETTLLKKKSLQRDYYSLCSWATTLQELSFDQEHYLFNQLLVPLLESIDITMRNKFSEKLPLKGAGNLALLIKDHLTSDSHKLKTLGISTSKYSKLLKVPKNIFSKAFILLIHRKHPTALYLYIKHGNESQIKNLAKEYGLTPKKNGSPMSTLMGELKKQLQIETRHKHPVIQGYIADLQPTFFDALIKEKQFKHAIQCIKSIPKNDRQRQYFSYLLAGSSLFNDKEIQAIVKKYQHSEQNEHHLMLHAWRYAALGQFDQLHTTAKRLCANLATRFNDFDPKSARSLTQAIELINISISDDATLGFWYLFPYLLLNGLFVPQLKGKMTPPVLNTEYHRIIDSLENRIKNPVKKFLQAQPSNAVVTVFGNEVPESSTTPSPKERQQGKIFYGLALLTATKSRASLLEKASNFGVANATYLHTVWATHKNPKPKHGPTCIHKALALLGSDKVIIDHIIPDIDRAGSAILDKQTKNINKLFYLGIAAHRGNAEGMYQLAMFLKNSDLKDQCGNLFLKAALLGHPEALKALQTHNASESPKYKRQICSTNGSTLFPSLEKLDPEALLKKIVAGKEALSNMEKTQIKKAMAWTNPTGFLLSGLMKLCENPNDKTAIDDLIQSVEWIKHKSQGKSKQSYKNRAETIKQAMLIKTPAAEIAEPLIEEFNLVPSIRILKSLFELLEKTPTKAQIADGVTPHLPSRAVPLKKQHRPQNV